MAMSLSSQVGSLETEVEYLRKRVEELEAIPHPEASMAWFSPHDDGGMGIKVLLKDWDDGHMFLSLSKIVSDEVDEIARNLIDSEGWAIELSTALEAAANQIREAVNAKA